MSIQWRGAQPWKSHTSNQVVIILTVTQIAKMTTFGYWVKAIKYFTAARQVPGSHLALLLQHCEWKVSKCWGLLLNPATSKFFKPNTSNPIHPSLQHRSLLHQSLLHRSLLHQSSVHLSLVRPSLIHLSLIHPSLVHRTDVPDIGHTCGYSPSLNLGPSHSLG